MANSIKRYVEKCWSRINHTISNSAGSLVLHTVGERETLVRAIIQLETESFTAQSAGAYNLAIVREPQGSAVFTPATGETLDQNGRKEVLWQYEGAFPNVDMHNNINVDLKSMRKLDPGDEIVLRDIAANASSIGVVGQVTLFLKQT